jgi:hypothetical protein
MKRIVLIALVLMIASDAFGQSNIIYTANHKFVTIKKGYTGDWAGSQTDTTGNSGMNRNALLNEILWSKIFNSTYWIQSTFRDSILKYIVSDTLPWNTATIRALKLVADSAKWNTVSQTVSTDSLKWNAISQSVGTDSIAWKLAATRAEKLVADSAKWNNAVPTYKELIGFITQTGTGAPIITSISSTYVNVPAFSYVDVGNYQCLTGTFEAELTNNTIIMIQPATDQGTPPIRPKVYANSNFDQNGTYLYITTYDTLNAVHNDQLLYGSTVIIRSYP